MLTSQTPAPALPWDHCKVAFGIQNERRVWRLSEDRSLLPPGWILEETDGTGARWVAIFSTETVPTAADGEKVLTALREIGARPEDSLRYPAGPSGDISGQPIQAGHQRSRKWKVGPQIRWTENWPLARQASAVGARAPRVDTVGLDDLLKHLDPGICDCQECPQCRRMPAECSGTDCAKTCQCTECDHCRIEAARSALKSQAEDAPELWVHAAERLLEKIWHVIEVEPERRALLACMPPGDTGYLRPKLWDLAKLWGFVSRWYEISAGEGAVDTEDEVALQALRRLLIGNTQGSPL